MPKKEGGRKKPTEEMIISVFNPVTELSCLSLLNINDMSVIQTWLCEQMVIMRQTKEQISLHYAEFKQNFQIDSGLHMKLLT